MLIDAGPQATPSRDDARTRLKTRLLNAYGAMLMIAFAAILVGVFSILDIANVASEQTAHSRVTLESTDTMKLKLDALSAEWFDRAVSGSPPDPGRTARATGAFRAALASARRHATGVEDRRLVATIEREFEPLAAALARAEAGSLDPAVPLLFERVRALCVELSSVNFASLERTTSGARDRARKVSILLLAVASAIALIVAWISTRVARSITQPLEAMVDAAERIAEGEFARRVPHSNVRELDRLASRFNLMAEALERLRAIDVGKLVREQRRIETVLESIDDGLLILDIDARVQRANAVALRQLGCTDTDVAGRSLDEVARGLELGWQAQTALASREAMSGELSIGEAGDERVIRWSMSPFHDGDRPGLVVVLRDVTDERLFESLRTQFVLRASHELRTPVTAVRMAFDLLAKRLPQAQGSREAELVQTIHQELGRLAQLITDLLDLSKMYSQTVELRPEDVAAADLLETTAQRFRLRAEESGVGLEVANEAPDVLVRVDRTHLERVLDNLVSNALRHTPAGGSVRLELQRHGPTVEFAVADTGSGIPLALQARIFEPFTQFGENAGGAGMGLALCREIVGRHGGRLTVRSAPGHGARFAFRIPVA